MFREQARGVDWSSLWKTLRARMSIVRKVILQVMKSLQEFVNWHVGVAWVYMFGVWCVLGGCAMCICVGCVCLCAHVGLGHM